MDWRKSHVDEKVENNDSINLNSLTNEQKDDIIIENRNNEISDDAFFDMLNHVIGLGKERYYEALEDIDKMWITNYKECFEYCFS